MALYAQALRWNGDFPTFYEVADRSVRLNGDNVHLLLVYLHASVQQANLERAAFALDRLRSMQKEYGLGVHNAASSDIYLNADTLEMLHKKGKPVSLHP